MTRWEGSRMLGGYRTGNEASEYNGEDGRMNEEFHKSGYLRG